MDHAAQVGTGGLVQLGGRAVGTRFGGERAEAGVGHAERRPGAGGGDLVEGLSGQVLGEVAEDQGGAVGVLDGLAGRSVQGLLEDAGPDGGRVGAVHTLQLGVERYPG